MILARLRSCWQKTAQGLVVEQKQAQDDREQIDEVVIAGEDDEELDLDDDPDLLAPDV